MREAHDGVWNGKRYYNCEFNRGTFVLLKDLTPCNKMTRRRSAGIYTI